MRKSLIEIEKIDLYLDNAMSPKEHLLFRIQLLISTDLREKVVLQKKIRGMINWLGRESQREQLRAIHWRLMQQPIFQKEVYEIFDNN